MSGREEYVRRTFDSIATQYDVMNRLMSLGLLGRWHEVFLEETDLGPGQRALDVCCGTGDLSIAMARRVGPGGSVVGIDFSPPMLSIARKKLASLGLSGRVTLIEGNAMKMPFPDDDFDCASIGFALRNVNDVGTVLREMKRVVRPGGSVVALELSVPDCPLIRSFVYPYMFGAIPLVDRLITPKEARGLRPYSYLPRSVWKFPRKARLAEMFIEAGLTGVRWRALTLGVAAVHRGTKPARREAGESRDR